MMIIMWVERIGQNLLLTPRVSRVPSSSVIRKE